jgi:hypothetical protein
VIAYRDVAALEHEIGAAPVNGSYVVVAITDLAGNLAGSRVEYTPLAAPPRRLVVSEVMSHPRGPQPAQEWVELANLDATPAPTAGLTIASGTAMELLPAALIPAGGFALVVGAGFVADDGADVPPAVGAALIRLPTASISGGLPNGGGTPVELRDAGGHVLSRYGGFVDVSPRSAAGTSVARIDLTACDLPANWRRPAHPTPGAPNQF